MQTNDLKTLFGKRIRSLRRLRDLTQEQLAASVGCSTEYISRIERGLVSPSFEILSALANAFHIEVDALFDFSELPTSQTPSPITRRQSTSRK